MAVFYLAGQRKFGRNSNESDKGGALSHKRHIWSPPVLQRLCVLVTGTGLLPYIRPVDEGIKPLASMKFARIVLINLPACKSGRGAYQVFDTPV